MRADARASTRARAAGVLSGPLADRWLAGFAVAVMGAGAVLALAGAGSGTATLAVAGGAGAGLALVIVLAHGWLDPLLLVALTAPLPALWSGEGVRVATVAPITAAAVAAWILQRGLGAPASVGASGPTRLLGPFALVLVAATAAAPSPMLALRELLNLLVLLGFLVAAIDWMRDCPPHRARVATAIALLAVGCSALALLEAVGVLPAAFPRWETRYYRAALGFGQPNNLALFLALALPLVVWRWSRAETAGTRALWAVGVALGGAGLLATFSRGGWAAVVVGAAALALAGQWRSLFRVAAGAVLAAIALDLLSGGMIRDTFARTVGDWVIEQRAALTWAGILMFLDRPLLGMGPGGFEAQLDGYGILVTDLWDFQPTPHNAYVQMAAEAGIGGLLLYLLLLAAFFRLAVAAVRREDTSPEGQLQRALLWSLGVVAVSGLFIWPYGHGTGQVVMLILALVATAPGARAATTPTRTSAP